MRRVPLLACPAVLFQDTLELSLKFSSRQFTMPDGLHRKRVRHYDEPGHCHELTFSCYLRLPLLTNNAWRAILSECLDRAMQRHRYALSAFVFMPEHVHLLVFPKPNASKVERLLKAIKRPCSFRIKKLLEVNGSSLLGRLTGRQRPHVATFRYWQEGPGYDRNIDSPSTAMSVIDYIHLNPVRRGLVEHAADWQWSSDRWYQDVSYAPQVRVPRLESLPSSFLDSRAR